MANNGDEMKKLSLYIFLVLMWSNPGFAECIKGNCVNGQGVFAFSNGDKAEVGSSSLPPATRILSILILFAYRFCRLVVVQKVISYGKN